MSKKKKIVRPTQRVSNKNGLGRSIAHPRNMRSTRRRARRPRL